MSSAASVFVHATRKRSQKVPRAKSGTFWFPWMDFHDSIALVLFYKTGTKFFIEWFQSYTLLNIVQNCIFNV